MRATPVCLCPSVHVHVHVHARARICMCVLIVYVCMHVCVHAMNACVRAHVYVRVYARGGCVMSMHASFLCHRHAVTQAACRIYLINVPHSAEDVTWDRHMVQTVTCLPPFSVSPCPVQRQLTNRQTVADPWRATGSLASNDPPLVLTMIGSERHGAAFLSLGA